MSLLESKALPLGTEIIDFSLPDPDGKMHSPSDYSEAKVLVIIFMCNHCPYVKAVRERLIALQANYDTTDVQFIGINANDWENYPDDSPEMMKQTIVDWGINFPYLYDESQETARAYQAQCTPDIYVFENSPLIRGDVTEKSNSPGMTEGFKLAYHGRIDDSWQDPEQVTKQELKEALDAIVQNRHPNTEQLPTIGCSIKWK